MAFAEWARQPDRSRNEFLALFNGCPERITLGKKCRNGRGIRATGAMGVTGEHPLSRNVQAFTAVEQYVDGVLAGEMSTLDEHIGGTHAMQLAGGLHHLGL